jgi:dihydroorotase
MPDASQSTFDLVLTGGTVLDPASGTNASLDVGVVAGRIAEIGPGLAARGESTQTVDCTGQTVLPGLVEGHTHIFQFVSKVGAPPQDAHLRRGVVAAADAGTAGASTFPAFRKLIVEANPMRIVNFLNVSVLGLIDFRFGELLNPETLVPEDALEVAAANPDVVRGFKIRMSDDVVGTNGAALLKKSVALAEQARLPLMVHIGETEDPLSMVLDELRAGDIVAHCYTGKPHGILEDGTVQPAVLAARERGVLFDSAHGKSNLSFEVARPAIADGFLPDIVSSDTSARNWRGPVFDLLTTLSKLVALGAPFEECVRRATVVPSQVLGLAEEGYGALRVGGPAHVTVVRQTDEVELPDAAGHSIMAPRYEPTFVLNHGEPVDIVRWRGEQ